MIMPKIQEKIPVNVTLQSDEYYTSLENITNDFLYKKNFTKRNTGEKENVNHGNYLIQWALQCNLDVYFKTKKNYLDNSEENSKIIDSFMKATNSMRICETGIQLWRVFSTLSWMDLTEHCKYVDKLITDEVGECLSTGEKKKNNKPVLETLLAAGELKSNDLLTPLMDLLIINVNLVASLAGFVLYNLSKAPQVQRNLFKEISSVVPKGGMNISQEDLLSFRYLNSCIMETLRVIPPIPVLSRALEEDTKIHGFQIPKGTFVQMVNVLHCNKGDPNNEDIGKFQAERWMDKPNSFKGDPLSGLTKWNAFPQFNKNIVMTQVALLTSKIVREYRLEYPTIEVFADGMVLQGPTSPFNFVFTERII